MATKKAKKAKPTRTWKRWLRALQACRVPNERTLSKAYEAASNGDKTWLLNNCDAPHGARLEICSVCNPPRKMPALVTKKFREWARR